MYLFCVHLTIHAQCTLHVMLKELHEMFAAQAVVENRCRWLPRTHGKASNENETVETGWNALKIHSQYQNSFLLFDISSIKTTTNLGSRTRGTLDFVPASRRNVIINICVCIQFADCSNFIVATIKSTQLHLTFKLPSRLIKKNRFLGRARYVWFERWKDSLSMPHFHGF